MTYRQAFIIFLIAFDFLGCTHRRSETWKVLMIGSFDQLKPTASNSDHVSYVLRQTHEPIFRRDENKQVVSRILNNWNRSEDYKSFRLCPNTNLEFANGQNLDASDLENSIKSTWSGITKFETKQENGCLSIQFREPRRNFFDALMSFGASPSRPTANPHIEMGLGPFRVEEFSKKRILLTRKQPDSSKRFDKIEIKNTDLMTADQIDDHSVQDFNMLRGSHVPAWVATEYFEYPNSNLENFLLVINVADFKIRQAIYNCIDVPALTEAHGHVKRINEIASLYPIGISGAKSGKIPQTCIKRQLNVSKPLVFINPKPENQAKYIKVFDDLTSKTGIPFIVKQISFSDLGHYLTDTHSGYDLAIVAVQNEFADMTDFLELIADQKKQIHSLSLPDLNQKYNQFKNTSDPVRRQKMGVALNDEILNLALTAPLFQPVIPIYYPKDVTLPSVGSSFTTAPEVDGIK